MEPARHLTIALLVLGALFLLLALVSCSSQSKPVEQVRVPPNQESAAHSSGELAPPRDAPAEHTVRLTNGEWPPYVSEYLAHYGPASRIVTEAFGSEGIKVEYGFFPWKRALESARTGEWDGSLVWLRTPEREQHFHFSQPVCRATYVFWHLKSFEFDWQSIEDIQGVTIGGTRGYFYEDIFSELAEAGSVTVEWVSNDDQNYAKLLTGRIDLYAQDIHVGNSMLHSGFAPEQRQRVTYHPRPLRVDDMCLILSRRVEKSDHLMALFNRGLERLREGGKMETYLVEAMGADSDKIDAP